MEGIDNMKEEGSLTEEGKQEDEWKEKEGQIVGKLGQRMVADGGERAGFDEWMEGNWKRMDDFCMGFYR